MTGDGAGTQSTAAIGQLAAARAVATVLSRLWLWLLSRFVTEDLL
jgi:hypothetical protein